MKSERTPFDKGTFEEKIKRITEIIDKRHREGKIEIPPEPKPFNANRSNRPEQSEPAELDTDENDEKENYIDKYTSAGAEAAYRRRKNRERKDSDAHRN